jgi:hypothetical protein
MVVRLTLPGFSNSNVRCNWWVIQMNSYVTNNTGGTFNDWISNSDVRVTGGTHSNGTAIFTNNTGGTFNVTGFSNTMYVSVLHSNECHYIY